MTRVVRNGYNVRTRFRQRERTRKSGSFRAVRQMNGNTRVAVLVDDKVISLARCRSFAFAYGQNRRIQIDGISFRSRRLAVTRIIGCGDGERIRSRSGRASDGISSVAVVCHSRGRVCAEGFFPLRGNGFYTRLNVCHGEVKRYSLRINACGKLAYIDGRCGSIDFIDHYLFSYGFSVIRQSKGIHAVGVSFIGTAENGGCRASRRRRWFNCHGRAVWRSRNVDCLSCTPGGTF